MAILNLGCGRKKRAGEVGVDMNASSDADVIHDLNVYPWPFVDNEFDGVVARHLVEHLDNIVQAMEEIHRVTKHGADIFIRTPHFSSEGSWFDPTHKYHLSWRSFDLFCFKSDEEYAYSGVRFEMAARRIRFRSGLIKSLGKLIASWWPVYYERQWTFIIPARSIHFHLRTLKSPR